jgi:hypothetical protein
MKATRRKDSLVCAKDLLVCTKDLLVCTKDSLVCTKDSLACTKDSLVCTKDSLACTKDPLVCTKDSLVCTKDSLVCTKDSLVCTKDLLVCTKDGLYQRPLLTAGPVGEVSEGRTYEHVRQGVGDVAVRGKDGKQKTDKLCESAVEEGCYDCYNSVGKLFILNVHI